MRKAEFEVPSEAMAQFAQEVADRGLENTINGANEDGEILVEVFYEKDESKLVDQLEEILEKLREQIEEDEDEEDEDEEEDD